MFKEQGNVDVRGVNCIHTFNTLILSLSNSKGTFYVEEVGIFISAWTLVVRSNISGNARA